MRWAIDPCVPWKGYGPLEVAGQTGSLDKALESGLANESSTPTGFLLPVPHAEQDEADDPLAPLFASDLSGRARAFASLVKSGMDIERAAGLAGLLQE